MPTTALRLAALLPILAILSGCGKPLASTVDVTGKVIFPPGLKFQDNDTITVTFQPDGESSAQGGSASLNGKDGAFSAKVPPGNYKVAVSVQPYPGAKTEDRKGEIAKAIGKYGLPTAVGGSKQPPITPLRYEVANTPTQAITIDLVKGTITKN